MIISLAIFSKGLPFLSNMASRRNGTIIITMRIAAALVPMWLFVRKNSGRPSAPPAPKQISCRFVRLNMTFVFTAFRSLGTGTYAIVFHLPSQWALKMLFASEPVLNREKHSSTVYPIQVQSA